MFIKSLFIIFDRRDKIDQKSPRLSNSIGQIKASKTKEYNFIETCSMLLSRLRADNFILPAPRLKMRYIEIISNDPGNVCCKINL